MQQLSLFPDESPPDVPEPIEGLLTQGAALAISISGGKDGQAMLNWLAHLRRERKWSGHYFAIHAHLGRAEWPETLAHCYQISEQAGIELIVVRREQGDLVDRWRERMQKLMAEGNTKPFWSSPQNRYCMSDLKRGPINKYLRQFDCVISAEGIRSQESTNRAKQSVVSVRGEITAARLKELSPQEAIARWQHQGRLALTWHPLQHWDVSQVWEWCDTSLKEYQSRTKLFKSGQTEVALSGWTAHPAYVRGNERLSCASVCPSFAQRSDQRGAAQPRPVP